MIFSPSLRFSLIGFERLVLWAEDEPTEGHDGSTLEALINLAQPSSLRLGSEEKSTPQPSGFLTEPEI